MKRWRAPLAVLFFAFVAMSGLGCEVLEETIVFQNRSGLNGVSCYVDGEYKGTVNSGYDLVVEGDYEGDRLLSATLGGLVWNTVAVHLDEGDTVYYSVGAR
jgi:hypothetical protein